MTEQHSSSATTPRPEKELVAGDFPVRLDMDTRWSDNDIFGHLNNAVYYQLFDSAINRWVIEGTGIQPAASPALPLVAESGCRYFRELRFPDPVAVGISVARLGRSSVTYRLGLLSGNESTPVAALGRWVHVYVDPATRKSSPIPAPIRELLETIAP